MTYQNSSPPPSWTSQLDLEREHRLTKVEVRADHLEVRADHSDRRHDSQDVWNKAFTVALLGLGSGLAHAKAGELLDVVLALLQGLRP